MSPRSSRRSHRLFHRAARHLAFAGLLALGLVAMRPAIGAAGVDVSGKVPGAGRGLPSVVILEPAGVDGRPAANEPPKLDPVKKSFAPGVVATGVGQVVEFRNRANQVHNIHLLNLASGKVLFDVALPVSGAAYLFTPQEAATYAVVCDLHPEMEGYLVVTEGRYYTVTDESGNFDLPEVPAGSYTLRVWSPRNATSIEKPVQVVEPRTLIKVGR